MNQTLNGQLVQSKRSTRSGPALPLLGLFVGVFLEHTAGWGQTVPTEVLRTAAQVRRLTPQQAEKHVPVGLRGVVTFYDEALFSRFVQDETAGIYLRE